MSERPIIFSAPMVLALLDRRKTMTRRLADSRYVVGKQSVWRKVEAGDHLYVRETWRVNNVGHDLTTVIYRASQWQGYTACSRQFPTTDFAANEKRLRKPGYISPIHMPRWASRVTLDVTAVRIERLQLISEEDALAEGCRSSYPFTEDGTARKDFRTLWNEIHGRGAWDANPEVVAISFTVHQANIGVLLELANRDG